MMEAPSRCSPVIYQFSAYNNTKSLAAARLFVFVVWDDYLVAPAPGTVDVKGYAPDVMFAAAASTFTFE